MFGSKDKDGTGKDDTSKGAPPPSGVVPLARPSVVSGASTPGTATPKPGFSESTAQIFESARSAVRAMGETAADRLEEVVGYAEKLASQNAQLMGDKRRLETDNDAVRKEAHELSVAATSTVTRFNERMKALGPRIDALKRTIVPALLVAGIVGLLAAGWYTWSHSGQEVAQAPGPSVMVAKRDEPAPRPPAAEPTNKEANGNPPVRSVNRPNSRLSA